METFEEFKAKNPHLEKVWPYLDILNAESDRGAVLVSSGFLEEMLKDILLAFMIDMPKAVDLLEGGNAPLGTFSARTEACFALGLISEVEYRELVRIRKIRNAFAHDIHTSFETDSIVDHCRALSGRVRVFEGDSDTEFDPAPSGQFRTAAVSLIMNLVNRAHYVGKKRCQAERWPY